MRTDTRHRLEGKKSLGKKKQLRNRCTKTGAVKRSEVYEDAVEDRMSVYLKKQHRPNEESTARKS
jgi:hypothetical protein